MQGYSIIDDLVNTYSGVIYRDFNHLSQEDPRINAVTYLTQYVRGKVLPNSNNQTASVIFNVYVPLFLQKHYSPLCLAPGRGLLSQVNPHEQDDLCLDDYAGLLDTHKTIFISLPPETLPVNNKIEIQGIIVRDMSYIALVDEIMDGVVAVKAGDIPHDDTSEQPHICALLGSRDGREHYGNILWYEGQDRTYWPVLNPTAQREVVRHAARVCIKRVLDYYLRTPQETHVRINSFVEYKHADQAGRTAMEKSGKLSYLPFIELAEDAEEQAQPIPEPTEDEMFASLSEDDRRLLAFYRKKYAKSEPRVSTLVWQMYLNMEKIRVAARVVDEAYAETQNSSDIKSHFDVIPTQEREEFEETFRIVLQDFTQRIALYSGLPALVHKDDRAIVKEYLELMTSTVSKIQRVLSVLYPADASKDAAAVWKPLPADLRTAFNLVEQEARERVLRLFFGDKLEDYLRRYLGFTQGSQEKPLAYQLEQLHPENIPLLQDALSSLLGRAIVCEPLSLNMRHRELAKLPTKMENGIAYALAEKYGGRTESLFRNLDTEYYEEVMATFIQQRRTPFMMRTLESFSKSFDAQKQWGEDLGKMKKSLLLQDLAALFNGGATFAAWYSLVFELFCIPEVASPLATIVVCMQAGNHPLFMKDENTCIVLVK